MDNKYTTIKIRKHTRSAIAELGRKYDTYDSIIQRLVETAAELSPQELEEVQTIINHMQQSQPNLNKEKVIGRLIKLGLDMYKDMSSGKVTPRYEGD